MKCKSLVFGVVCVMGVLLVSGAEAQSRHLTIFRSPLYDAVLAGNAAVTRLLEGETDVNDTDTNKMTLLHYAAAENKPHLVRLLLEEGASKDQPGQQERTPLHYAVMYYTDHSNTYKPGTKSALRVLLNRGADVAAQDFAGWTPLYIAVWKEDNAVVRLLLKYAVQNEMDIDGQEDNFGHTALHQAAEGDSKTIVKLLLEAGADTEVTDTVTGATPLHIAAQDFPASVGLFIRHGADVNAATNSGATPLDKAVHRGNGKAVRLLKKAGAKHSDDFDPNPEGD